MTPERGVEITKLILPLIAAAVFMIVGLVQHNLALVGLGAGSLGVPYLTTDVHK